MIQAATAIAEKPRTAEEEHRPPVNSDYFRQIIQEQGIAVDSAYFGSNLASRIKQAAHPERESSDSVEDAPDFRDISGDRSIDAVMHLYASATALRRNLGEVLVARVQGEYALGFK